MRIVTSEKIPPANGHYSPMIEHGGILYLSGQLPIDPQTKLIPETIEEQMTLVLSKIELLLTEGGSSRDKVLQVRIYLSDISLWGKVNEVYADFFMNHKPVRSIVPSRELHYGCMIEIEATAVI